MAIQMASGCTVLEDSTGFSSDDEFGWNVAEINNDKQLMLMNDIRMALSGGSSPSSSESDDGDLDTQNVHSRLSCNGTLRSHIEHPDMTEGSKERHHNRSISNTVSDSDSDDLRERTFDRIENKRSESFNVVLSGDSAVTSSKSNKISESTKNNVLTKCTVSSSSCVPLQVEEVMGVDVNHFTIDSSEPSLFCEDLTEDDEVWLVQCPKNVNPHAFKEKLFLTPATSKITVGQEQVLEVSSYSQCPKAQTFLLPCRRDSTCKLVVLKPAGQIVIREHINIPRPTVNEITKKKITFPVGLKMRHPLLGADYEKELKSYTESLKRLGSHHKQKKKNKKRKRDAEFSISDAGVDSDENVCKQKKRKLYSENTCEDTLIFNEMPEANEDFHSSHSLASKKMKRHSVSLDNTSSVENTEESNMAIKECSAKPKKKKHKSSLEIDEESPSTLKNIREHRKRKHECIETSFETSAEFSEKEHEKDIKYQKKQEKKIRKLNIDTVEVDPNSDMLVRKQNTQSLPFPEACRGSVTDLDRDTADITEPRENSATESLADLNYIKKKKKKKERNSVEGGASLHHSVIGISVDVEKRSKKKKEKHKRNISLDLTL